MNQITGQESGPGGREILRLGETGMVYEHLLPWRPGIWRHRQRKKVRGRPVLPGNDLYIRGGVSEQKCAALFRKSEAHVARQTRMF